MHYSYKTRCQKLLALSWDSLYVCFEFQILVQQTSSLGSNVDDFYDKFIICNDSLYLHISLFKCVTSLTFVKLDQYDFTHVRCMLKTPILLSTI